MTLKSRYEINIAQENEHSEALGKYLNNGTKS